MPKQVRHDKVIMMIDNKQFDGSILAARYAFMPNKLRYCGGDTNSEIFEYITRQQTDPGLQTMLGEFQTMFPYLKLIAESNKILDPFNYKVVEAYWIGNELLENVSMQNFYKYLVDEQKLKKRFKLGLLEKVFGKIPVGAKPHHSFHVLNIPKRTGYYPIEHTLETMDECRIAPAKIIEILNGKMKVEYQPLIMNDNKIEVGEPVKKEVFTEINKKAFVRGVEVGDFVSLHWSWVCDSLTKDQVDNLNKWTKFNLALLNLNYA